MLANIIFRNAGEKCLTIRKSRNADDKSYQFYFSEMLTIDGSNYVFQKCWRQVLAIITFENDDDRGWQL